MTTLLNISILLCLWIISFSLSWYFLSHNNFYYATWYQLLDIDQTIKTYSPQNRFGKQNFVQTNAEQHELLFSEIVTAINNGGNNLKSISYKLNNVKMHDEVNHYPLLTQAEVIHLKDVATIIGYIKRLFCLSVILVMISIGVVLRTKCMQAWTFQEQFRKTLVGVSLLLLATLLVGPKDFFYWLHEVVFPSNHQWFFYYQDSLMSTIMQAPNIFGPISILWISLAFVFQNILTVLFQCFTTRKVS